MKCNPTFNKCPCCGTPKRYSRTYFNLTDKRSIAYTVIQNSYDELEIPKLFTPTILALLVATLEGNDFPSPFPTLELMEAVHSQNTAGMHNMAIGFYLAKLTESLETLGLDRPSTLMAHVYLS